MIDLLKYGIMPKFLIARLDPIWYHRPDQSVGFYNKLCDDGVQVSYRGELLTLAILFKAGLIEKTIYKELKKDLKDKLLKDYKLYIEANEVSKIGLVHYYPPKTGYDFYIKFSDQASTIYYKLKYFKAEFK